MSIKSIFESIKEAIKDRKKVVIILVVIAVVLIIYSIVSMMFSKPDIDPIDSDKYLIEPPMQVQESHSISLPPSLYNSKGFPKSLDVYQIDSVTHTTNVETFLTKIGRTGLKKENVQGSFYSWENQGSKVDYLQYQQQLKFIFSDPFKVSLTTQFNGSDDIVRFFEGFMTEYFGKTYKYTNGKVTSEGRRSRIEVNRLVGQYPVYLQNHFTYTDSLLLDEAGNIYEGTLTMFEFKETGDTIDLVHASNLQRLLASEIYPKDIFEGYSEELAKLLNQPGIEHLDAADQLIEIPTSRISEAKSISLVYYYANDSYKQVVPVYRIEATGVITYAGKQVSIPLVIYANALDPDRVYISSEE
jgi:hypothetical protein